MDHDQIFTNVPGWIITYLLKIFTNEITYLLKIFTNDPGWIITYLITILPVSLQRHKSVERKSTAVSGS